GGAARQRRQVLLQAAGRRELVRRHPAPAQRAGGPAARLRWRARADRRPPGDRELLPLPAGVHGRGRNPRYRPQGRRAQLFGHRLCDRTRRPGGAVLAGGRQPRAAAARGRRRGDRRRRRARRPAMSRTTPTGSSARALGAGLLRGWPLPTPDGGGKEARGRVLVVGGHRELAGAVRLAGEAALRAGAGKLQIAVARGAATALAVAVPEARVLGLVEDANGGLAGTGRELPGLAENADAVVLGPGADAGPKLRAMAARLLTRAQRSAVLDAGAIDLALLRSWRR